MLGLGLEVERRRDGIIVGAVWFGEESWDGDVDSCWGWGGRHCEGCMNVLLGSTSGKNR